jgi:hypothetical protein
MHNQDPNNYWEQLERLEKLIRASELKSGVLFSFHSLILGLIADRLHTFKPIFENSMLLIVLGSIWILFVLISIFYCFKCFQPQMEMKYHRNVFFFRDAVKKFGNVDEYTKTLMQICNSQEEMFKQLGEQIHAESTIIDVKFKHVHNAIKFFGLSFFLLLIIIVTIVAQQ